MIIRLTDRDRRILTLMVDGKPIKEIAALLGKSPSYMNNICMDLYGRIGARSRSEAAVWWVRETEVGERSGGRPGGRPPVAAGSRPRHYREETMLLAAIHPVLLVPGGSAPEGDGNILRDVLQTIQSFWETAGGCRLLMLDPKVVTNSPLAPVEPLSWWNEFPGGPVFAAQDFALRHGYLEAEDLRIKAMVFLDGYPSGHGDCAGRTAIVSYDAVRQLTGINKQRAIGLMCHEIGHLLGLLHIDTPDQHELMSGTQAWWSEWPNVAVSQKPTG